MIGCLRTHVRKQPIIVLYFEFETILKFYNLEASSFFPIDMIAKQEIQWEQQRINNHRTTDIELIEAKANERGLNFTGQIFAFCQNTNLFSSR